MARTIPNELNGAGHLKGVHVLLWLAGFFGVMLVVNGFFLFYAITTFPGEDVKKSYAQGLDYNSTLAQRAAQAELGWQAEIGIADNQIEIRIVDSTGAGVSGHEVHVQLRRLATTAGDTQFVAVPQGAGIYRADVSALAPGQWEVIAKVQGAGAKASIFEARKRVVVK